MSSHVMTVPEMFQTRSVASNIISRHGTPNDVLDQNELSLLNAFCRDPTQKTKVLAERGMLDEPGQELGTKAQKAHGSLVGYIISKHQTPDAILRDEEIVELRSWFESGQA